MQGQKGLWSAEQPFQHLKQILWVLSRQLFAAETCKTQRHTLKYILCCRTQGMTGGLLGGPLQGSSAAHAATNKSLHHGLLEQEALCQCCFKNNSMNDRWKRRVLSSCCLPAHSCNFTRCLRSFSTPCTCAAHAAHPCVTLQEASWLAVTFTPHLQRMATQNT